MQIVLVEDDKYFRAQIKRELGRYGDVYVAKNVREAKALLDQNIDLAIIDLSLEESEDGLLVLEYCSKRAINSVVLTSYDHKEIIKKAYELGCQHYFQKREFQKNIVEEIEKLFNLLRHQKLASTFEQRFLTKSASFKQRLEALMLQATYRGNNILLTGPTGVGKSYLAKLIHEQHDKNAPFMAVNLNEIPSELVSSTLFGHEKGSFTGAENQTKGLIELADGGTLFIDEIGSLTLDVQKKLLRVIDERSFSSLGSRVVKRSNFRLISATCEDLTNAIKEGTFRVDLYFRIRGLHLDIPPLAQRREDIIPLIEFFAEKLARKFTLTREAEKALRQYDWFGNTRELCTLTQELANLGPGIVSEADLPSYISMNVPPFTDQSDDFNSRLKKIIEEKGLSGLIGQIEQQALAMALEESGGKINEAARRLKISKGLLYRLLKDQEAR